MKIKLNKRKKERNGKEAAKEIQKEGWKVEKSERGKR
jgi:hypothetical protein